MSEHCIKFCECFEQLADKSKRAKANRVQAWMALDNNHNGYVSLAETGKWIKDTLINYTHSRVSGEVLYKTFYPSYIRAFKDAADAGRERDITDKADTDDYVQQFEFRLLCAYLCIYAIMFDHFAKIDGGSKSVGYDGVGIEGADDDRRISRKEWDKARKQFKRSPFVSLRMVARKSKRCRKQDAKISDAIFDEMDADGKGMVLLAEFCNWIKEGEIELGTQYGKVLEVDKDEDSAGEEHKGGYSY